MAKQTILKERGTGEVMYPQTLASLVKTSTGENVDDGLEKAKFALFVDLWTRCYDCQYDATKAKPFTCNGVALTYQEAIDVYNAPRISYPRPTGLCGNYNKNLAVKTLIFVDSVGLYVMHDLSRFIRGSKIINLRLANNNSSVKVSNIYDAFGGCATLIEVNGIIDISEVNTGNSINAFTYAVSLREIRLLGLTINLNLQWQKELSYESLRYLVDNATNTSPITVTVHPDVYAKLTGDTTNEAAGVLTEEEEAAWQQVLADAVEKNISFATA